MVRNHLACSLAAFTLLGTAAGSQASNVFTIGVIPDTQNYVDYNNAANPGAIQLFKDETTYLANNKTALNLAFVTHVGDVVQHGDLQKTGDVVDGEWVRAQSALNILSASGVPFGLSPGNHDYDNYSHSSPGNRPLSGSVKWNQYFGPGSSYFSGKSWYGGSFNGGLNSYQSFTGGGKGFLHINLEMCATNNALNWAQGVIDAHPGVPTIITTHDFIDPGTQTRSGDIGSYFPNSPENNSPDQIWSKLITKNDQIFLVLNGHAWTGTDSKGQSNGENLRIDNNDAGHPVYQVLSDLQGNTFDASGTPGVYTGGAGWLRFMTFDLDAGTIHFQTYSPVLNQYAGVAGGPTFGIDPGLSDFTLAIPSQVPEPASLGALMLAGAAMLVRRRTCH